MLQELRGESITGGVLAATAPYDMLFTARMTAISQVPVSRVHGGDRGSLYSPRMSAHGMPAS